MRLLPASYQILTPLEADTVLQNIEHYGRVCYKSDSKGTAASAAQFVKMLIQRGHESVLEHEKISILFVCDRGVSHELVRHRIASFSQESTRYCNYASDRFGNELTFIIPPFFAESTEAYALWYAGMQQAEDIYLELLSIGVKPEEARSVLPHSLKTEIVVTMNMRELRHFLTLRAAPAAHPQMRALVLPLLAELQVAIPVLFDDIQAT